jgi:hypothetical protein
MLRCVNDGVKTIKHGHQTTAKALVIWPDVPYIRKDLLLENAQGSLQSGMPCSNSDTRGRFCVGLGSSIAVQYSVDLIITLDEQNTACE